MYILYHKDISVVTYINLYSDISVFHISRSSTVSTFPHVLRSRTGTGGPGAAVEHGHLQNHRRQGRGSVCRQVKGWICVSFFLFFYFLKVCFFGYICLVFFWIFFGPAKNTESLSRRSTICRELLPEGLTSGVGSKPCRKSEVYYGSQLGYEVWLVSRRSKASLAWRV